MRGFTLIELMVVIAIIAIIVVIAVPSYNEYNNNQKLADAANQLQTVLRQAQNNAQTGTACVSSSILYKATKWTIKLYSDRYEVSPVCDFSTYPAGTPTPTPSLRSNPFPSGITISDVQIIDSPLDTTPCSESLPATIEYTNLSSSAVISDLSGCTPGVNAIAKIILCLNCPSTNTRTIKVETGGGIYVEQ